MKHHSFVELLQVNPVICAVSHLEKLEDAFAAPGDIIFMLTGDIMNLAEVVSQCHEHKKYVFVHLDLIKGFSRDAVSLKYIKEVIKADGVISTKISLLKIARSEGLLIVQRLFMLDSTSYQVSVNSVHSLYPDAIEIMPGIMPKVIRRTCQTLSFPIICGGLIDCKEEAIMCLKNGATAISTTATDLWYE